MRSRKKLGLIIAATAAAAIAIVGAGAVNASLDRDSDDLYRLLLASSEHPAGSLIDSEMSIEEATQKPLPAPWGMVWSPSSCQNFLAESVPTLFESKGWIRSTDRTSANFRHDNHYFDMVAEVDAGVDLKQVRAAALSCSDGTLTLDDTVTGKIRYSEVPGRELPDAESLTMNVEISFPEAKNAEEAAIMAKYGYGSGAAIDIIKKELLILIGNLLYTVLSPDAEVAQRAVDVFHENATK
ncbi:hypothetical protein HCB17_09075 [Salinispora arenicola]|uniref:hypothetical protein n=1 Tax=Salinispora arenicola TaxID=168697 RepID=UPI0004819B57|nr:hypothetical protein [Salinispora arenicola]NIL41312.1 hypothetical protein [Salinispora arenicola]